MEPPDEDDAAEIAELNFEGSIRMGDIALKAKDFSSLEDNGLIEDDVILFFLEYQRNLLFSEYKDVIEVISPAVTNFLQTLENEQDIRAHLSHLNLSAKKIALFVLHEDNHWSLMVYSPPQKSFVHFDSMKSGMHAQLGKAFAQRLHDALCGQEEEFRYKNNSDWFQSNTFDCGTFVMGNAHRTLRHVFWDGKSLLEDKFSDPPEIDSTELRKELIAIVLSLTHTGTEKKTSN
jgi:sentrin-specific protease 8